MSASLVVVGFAERGVKFDGAVEIRECRFEIAFLKPLQAASEGVFDAALSGGVGGCARGAGGSPLRKMVTADEQTKRSEDLA